MSGLFGKYVVGRCEMDDLVEPWLRLSVARVRLDSTSSQGLRIGECRRVLRVPAVPRSRHGLKSGAGRWMLRVAPEAEERARERKPRVSKGERDREREEGNGERARVRETARREGLIRGDREGGCVYSGRE